MRRVQRVVLPYDAGGGGGGGGGAAVLGARLAYGVLMGRMMREMCYCVAGLINAVPRVLVGKVSFDFMPNQRLTIRSRLQREIGNKEKA